MAEIVRERTEDPEIRTLATDVALTQQAQIGQMQGWLAVWGLPSTALEPRMAWMGHQMDGPMPGMATSEEIRELGELPPEEADIRFLELMILHHRAALDMAEAALEETDRPEVEQLAGAIGASQETEIATMEDMLSSKGGEAPAEETSSPEGDSHGGQEHGS